MDLSLKDTSLKGSFTQEKKKKKKKKKKKEKEMREKPAIEAKRAREVGDHGH